MLLLEDEVAVRDATYNLLILPEAVLFINSLYDVKDVRPTTRPQGLYLQVADYAIGMSNIRSTWFVANFIEGGFYIIKDRQDMHDSLEILVNAYKSAVFGKNNNYRAIGEMTIPPAIPC